jgi:hypothetical protein
MKDATLRLVKVASRVILGPVNGWKDQSQLTLPSDTEVSNLSTVESIAQVNMLPLSPCNGTRSFSLAIRLFSKGMADPFSKV